MMSQYKDTLALQVQKNSNAELALALSIVSFAGYFFPIGGIALAVVAAMLARKALAKGQSRQLAMTALTLSVTGIIFCVVMQIYLLATFRVG